jgi:hypothetical protein
MRLHSFVMRLHRQSSRARNSSSSSTTTTTTINPHVRMHSRSRTYLQDQQDHSCDHVGDYNCSHQAVHAAIHVRRALQNSKVFAVFSVAPRQVVPIEMSSAQTESRVVVIRVPPTPRRSGKKLRQRPRGYSAANLCSRAVHDVLQLESPTHDCATA